jgi:hypothetical protein
MHPHLNQGFFCGVGFSRSVAPNETMPHMSRDHDSWATNVMVPNPNEMISIITPMTRANARLPKPQGVDERLDPQCSEV